MNQQHEIEEVKRHHNLFFGNSPVRIIEDDHGQPWWVVKDVCEILEHSQAAKAVAGLDSDEVKKIHLANSTGHLREMIAVNESGLYTLIIRSHKPQAKPFRKWVTSEVLPTIRKTGGYIHPAAEQVAAPAESRLLVALAETTSRMFESMTSTLEKVASRIDRLEAARPLPKAVAPARAARPKIASYGAFQVAGFVQACCRTSATGACRKEVLYRHYQAFCQEHGFQAFTYNGFFRLLWQATGVRQSRAGSGSRLVLGIVPDSAPRQRSLPGAGEHLAAGLGHNGKKWHGMEA